MKYSYDSDFKHTIYVDEAGRGCLAGPVFAGAVVWPKSPPKNDTEEWTKIKDSKKLSRKVRSHLVPYIEQTCISAVGTSSVDEIEKINILEATYLAMHRAIEQCIHQLPNVSADDILLCIDGNNFKPFIYNGEYVTHTCILKGDNTFVGIAAGSILAKVSHDNHILKICSSNPVFNDNYGWEKNMCYGTQQHREGIQLYGVTNHHRKTFNICKGAKKYKI